MLQYQVQVLLADSTEADGESKQTQSHISQEEVPIVDLQCKA